MSSLPSQHPSLSLHLTDAALTPLVTSSSSPSHLDSLTSLASTALTSHSAASRVNLGCPQRIMVEYPDHGAVVLQSYIEPAGSTASNNPASPSTATSTSSTEAAAAAAGADPDEAPPRLVSVVVAASADQTREARRAAARLERLGHDFQREWVAETSQVSDSQAPRA